MKQRILYIFTRTPLHVGAGSSVGAIDQPVQRERHTGFPIIPASSLKGSFADAWTQDYFPGENGGRLRVKTMKNGKDTVLEEAKESAWLFGSDDASLSFAGSLLFCEARLLAFPIRSARGGFAWVTCPLILARAARDGVLGKNLIPEFPKATDGQPDRGDEFAFFTGNGPLALGDKVVLEEYTFTRIGNDEAAKVGTAMAGLLAGDPVWNEVSSRLVILDDGMMSFFVQNACEVAQHVRIDDETGVAASGALFNQENVPSETLFYALVNGTHARHRHFDGKTEDDALNSFEAKLKSAKVCQFGGDASTGLGFCTVEFGKGLVE